MKMLWRLHAALLVCLALPGAAELSAPVQEVLQVLTSLQQKVSEEGVAAEKVFNEEKQFCTRRSHELRYSHDGIKADHERNDAELSQAQLELESWGDKLEDLANAVASDENDLQEATALRSKDAKLFAEAEKGLASTVDALDRALGIIGHEQRKSYESKSLLQMEETGAPIVAALSAIVEASGVSTADQQQLTALLQSARTETSEEEKEDEALDDALGVKPVAAAYRSKSSRLVAVLNDILEKAQTELEELRNDEQKKLRTFELKKQSLVDRAALKKRDLAAAKEARGEAAQRKALAEKRMSAAKASLSEAASSLQDLQRSCLDKAAKFEEETQARTDEVKALQEAKDVISSKMRGSVSFLQLKRRGWASARASSAEERAAAAAARRVRRLAIRVDSPVLIELAGRLDYAAKSRSSSGGDSLDKVRGLISDMITRLQAEARAEGDHQAFCDKEMSVAAVKRDDREASVDKLGTKIDKAQSQLTLFTEQAAVLRKELADLAESKMAMDKVRSQEKALFEQSQKDTQDGVEGMRMALQVMRTFYAKMGDAGGRSDHVISVLEFAASEMRRRATDLEAKEKQAASEYERISSDAAVMQATKQHEVEARAADATALEKLLNELNSDHAAAKEELDALQDYTAKLQDQCVAKPVPYEERKKKREKELSGLKEALAALEGGAQLQVDERTAVNTVFLQLRGSTAHAAA